MFPDSSCPGCCVHLECWRFERFNRARTKINIVGKRHEPIVDNGLVAYRVNTASEVKSERLHYGLNAKMKYVTYMGRLSPLPESHFSYDKKLETAFGTTSSVSVVFLK